MPPPPPPPAPWPPIAVGGALALAVCLYACYRRRRRALVSVGREPLVEGSGRSRRGGGGGFGASSSRRINATYLSSSLSDAGLPSGKDFMVGSPASPLAREAFDAALRQNGNVENSQKLEKRTTTT